MPTKALRSTRALTLGATLVLLTLLGHDAGGGHPPAVFSVGLAALLAWALAGALTRRRLPLPALFVVLCLGQVLLHLVMSTGSHATAISSAMVIGHVVAAAAAALVFDRGEAVAARWLAYLASRLGTPKIDIGPVASTTPVASSATPMRSNVCRHDVVRRGPPLMAATPI